jgi:hypothetical protein
MLVKEHAPTPDSLGATNGLVLFAMALTRSFCPAFVRYVVNQVSWLVEDRRLTHLFFAAHSLHRWLIAKFSLVISGSLSWQLYPMLAPYSGITLRMADNHLPIILVRQASRSHLAYTNKNIA